MTGSRFLDAVLMLTALAPAIICHEVAHGVAALWLGDDTAKRAGRLTLNPIPHIDPFASILLPVLLVISGSSVVFGGAKPVPVNIERMRDPRKGLWVTAIAGPVTNFVLALLSALLLRTLMYLLRDVTLGDFAYRALNIVVIFLYYSVIINLVLMVFNLLPIPPLDGSRVVAAFLPPRQAGMYLQLGKMGFVLIFLLLYLGAGRVVILPAVNTLERLLLGEF